MKPGVYDLPADQYHADQLADTPTLSAGTVKRLITQSPLHAWTHHPKLNPAYEPTVSDKFDLGTVAHELLLHPEIAQRVQVVEADDWRTKLAKEARADIRANDGIPLLAKDWQRVAEMVVAVRDQLAALNITPALFADGKPEQTLIWEEPGGVVCKARLDWLHDSLDAVDDFKSTSASANAHDWARRTFWSIGCDIQVAFHLRGLKAVTGRVGEWRYVVAETQPPYGLSVIGVAPSVLELGKRKVEWAIGKWRECVDRDEWPGYPGQIASVEVDGWQDVDFLARTWDPAAEDVAA